MKKLFRITFLSILLICGAVTTVRADYFWSENCQQAYAEAIRLDFESATKLCNQEKKERPENLLPIYIESQIDFLKSFIDEDKKQLEELKPETASGLTCWKNTRANLLTNVYA
ncbi:MAG: hypothetical protein IPM91_20105 [Bacteroidetes bacterium]|nr:hypothetical protein [Bacteroidota bacterium]